MASTFKLKVCTPNETVLDEEVKQIVVSTIDGEVGILPGHIPLITPLNPSPLQYWKNDEVKIAAVLGGMMKVTSEGVTIVTDHAALEGNIESLIQKKEKELEEAKTAQKSDQKDVLKAEMDLKELLHNLRAVQEITKRLRK